MSGSSGFLLGVVGLACGADLVEDLEMLFHTEIWLILLVLGLVCGFGFRCCVVWCVITVGADDVVA